MRLVITLAALWCGLAVALGAFGAHGLKSALAKDGETPAVASLDAFGETEAGNALKNWETGSRYHLLHGIAALLAGGLAWVHQVRGVSRTSPSLEPAQAMKGSGKAMLAAVLFLAGSAIFSGLLYAMVLGGPRILGAIVPIGGTAMIAGWVLLAIAAWQIVGSEVAD